MKKIKKLFLTLICLFFIFSTTVLADVGSFEDYDSGGSWDSGSSWSDSSWDHDYSSGSSSGSSIFFFGGGSWFGIVVFLIIVAVAVYSNSKKAKYKRNEPSYQNNRAPSDGMQDRNALETRQTQIENKIQVNAPAFNKEEFIAWSKNLFIKLQQAWTDRDWSTIRTFETENLFEQHKNQLQGYINNNQINVMDRICVNYAHLYAYREEGDKEILTVRLNSRMADYIIDASTKEVIRGDKKTERVNTYLLTFIRKNGVKTKPGTTEVNTTNCPNCGAPTQITSSGKCEYCGSVMTTGEYNWILSNLEKEKY